MSNPKFKLPVPASVGAVAAELARETSKSPVNASLFVSLSGCLTIGFDQGDQVTRESLLEGIKAQLLQMVEEVGIDQLIDHVTVDDLIRE